MKILLIGGGNSTHVFSVLAKYRGHDVTILTRNKDKWSGTLSLDNWDLNLIDKKTITVSGIKIIEDYNSINKDYEMIVLAGVPVEFYEEIMVLLEPHINTPVYFGSVCAYGGFQLIAKHWKTQHICAFWRLLLGVPLRTLHAKKSRRHQ